MLSKEEIEKAKNEGYEIIRDFRKATTEFTKDILPKKANAIKTLIEGIDQLETENKELGKGQHKLMQSRRKWKNRYYKERQKNRKYFKNL